MTEYAASPLAELDRSQRHDRDSLARWELVPSYHLAWQNAYAQARAGYGWPDPAQAPVKGAGRAYLPLQPRSTVS